MQTLTSDDPTEIASLIRRRLDEADLKIDSVETREFPEETIFVVRVPMAVERAVRIANQIDRELAGQGFKGFVTVRQSEKSRIRRSGPVRRGIADSRVKELLTLITARARTSEAQPSLSYIPESIATIQKAVAQRHHLIFGRRGAGKTALMLEAKRRVERQGAISIWLNLQTHRHEPAGRIFAWVGCAICERILSFYAAKEISTPLVASVVELQEELQHLRDSSEDPLEGALRCVPRLQSVVKRFHGMSAVALYVFLDELHYLPRDEQPKLLDMLHGVVRDSDAWLKIAGIRHLSRWFQNHPPLGLQTGHDADHIDLDVTLENPSSAKSFLERVLSSYAEHVGIRSLSGIFSKAALDRLVLASGAVPRDYLVLSSRAVQQAQARQEGRLVGVQDVNGAAGEAARVKVSELEEDAASAKEIAQVALAGLQAVRKFCVEQRSCTFFRVDFRDKETHSREYGVVQELMDLRLVHLVESSLSDEHEAGRRFEVYMLDLSQFSGRRLRRSLKVLDFENGHIVLKETGTTGKTKVALTPRQRLGILRRAPIFELSTLTTLWPSERSSDTARVQS